MTKTTQSSLGRVDRLGRSIATLSGTIMTVMVTAFLVMTAVWLTASPQQHTLSLASSSAVAR
jgi:glycerol-3-phosphate acyltransferase PlsY